MSVKVYICNSASHQDQPGLIYTVKSGYFSINKSMLMRNSDSVLIQ